MVALAAFVVIAHQPMPALAVEQRVLEPMGRAFDRVRHEPDLQLQNRAVVEDPLRMEEEFRVGHAPGWAR